MKPKKWLYRQAIKNFTLEVMGLTSHNIWQGIEDDESFELFGDTHDFNFKKVVFFDFMDYALRSNYLKLANHDEFLTGSVAWQVNLWKKAFPNSEKALLTNDGVFYIWFFSKECPAGFVWLLPQEGGGIYEHWT